MIITENSSQKERIVTVWSGLPLLFLNLLLFFGAIAGFVLSLVWGIQWYGYPIWWMMIVSLVLFITAVICFGGFFTLEPNEARVLVLFGEYKGTVRESGFHWGNPFYSSGPSATCQTSTDGKTTTVATMTVKHRRNKISLRARNLNGEKLKVNDKSGNPIEIAAVIVWRVRDTAQAMFDVDDYEHYVSVQSEAALRHIASRYSYDNGEGEEVTLRGGMDQVSIDLQNELQDRLGKAGVAVEEARLSHLAYAPEIAQAMLRRQQAEAVIAARQKIVHGAVGMVQMALAELAEKQVIEMDAERKAAMVSNLLVVLCGESEVHPVVNTGTLYT